MRLLTFLLLLFAVVFVAAQDAAPAKVPGVSRRLPGALSRSRTRGEAVGGEEVEGVEEVEEVELEPADNTDGVPADALADDPSPPPPPHEPRRVHEPSFDWSPSVLPVTGEGVMAVVFAGVLLSAAYFGL
ncbi:uncharacterized protein LOC62_05G007765 [Vanrija pseudolonga]|uniref:Uncharacterized protein n=1 Tax=Vanrija pseudolonga TaxID=143232 RepID=A0AAF0YCJ3_9TREE|nr:hypothetical protein LOC62_05G007765 [Vanrija pseudolonga]